MIVFCGITPHSPLLLDSVNKDKLQFVEKTREALKELSEELYASHPDVILLISEHPTSFSEAFSINVSDPYTFNLEDFGDLGFERTFRPDLALIDRLQRSLRKGETPVTLTTDTALHYASAVPLHFLAEKLPDTKLVPVTYSDASPKKHYQFGQAMKDIVSLSDKRIAIIVSADMSHALSEESPAGYHTAGAAFDESIMDLITTKNTAGILSLNDELIQESHQTIYLPLLVLLGLMEKIPTNTQILSYEAPFGVGYLVANLQIK